MISVTIFKIDHQYRGFVCEGHAGCGEEGYDIICSAVSALAINTVNSLEQFTQDEFSSEQSEDGGYLKLELSGGGSDEAQLLMKSLHLGLQMIEEEYGCDYVTVRVQQL